MHTESDQSSYTSPVNVYSIPFLYFHKEKHWLPIMVHHCLVHVIIVRGNIMALGVGELNVECVSINGEREEGTSVIHWNTLLFCFNQFEWGLNLHRAYNKKGYFSGETVKTWNNGWFEKKKQRQQKMWRKLMAGLPNGLGWLNFRRIKIEMVFNLKWFSLVW